MFLIRSNRAQALSAMLGKAKLRMGMHKSAQIGKQADLSAIASKAALYIDDFIIDGSKMYNNVKRKKELDEEYAKLQREQRRMLRKATGPTKANHGMHRQ